MDCSRYLVFALNVSLKPTAFHPEDRNAIFKFTYRQATHTAYVVYVNFIQRNLQFKIVSEQHTISEKLFLINFIYSENFCQKSAAEIFFHISFC